MPVRSLGNAQKDMSQDFSRTPRSKTSPRRWLGVYLGRPKASSMGAISTKPHLFATGVLGEVLCLRKEWLPLE